MKAAAAIAMATRMITKGGEPAVLRSRVVGAYDPATGSASVSTSNQAVTVVPQDMRRSGITTENGNNVMTAKRLMYLSPQGLVLQPLPNDQVLAGEFVWTIEAVGKIKVNGIVVLYTLTVVY